MPCGESIDQWDLQFFAVFADDLNCILPIRNGIIIHVCHPTKQNGFQSFKLTGSTQIHHHAIDVVEIFIQVFEEQDLALRLNGLWATT